MTGMTESKIHFENRESPEIAQYLENRLYEYNVQSTGIADGTMLNAVVENEAREIIAGINGHTWGGCCEIKQLWVAEAYRSQGLGKALLLGAMQEAVLRGCKQILISTHSFQAPTFYENLGFTRVAEIPDYPQGYEQIIYVRKLSRSQHLKPDSLAQ